MSEITGTISSSMSLEEAIKVYSDIIPSFFSTMLLSYLPQDLLDYSVKKLLRLVAIICGYIMFRKLIMRQRVIKAGKETEEKLAESEQVDDMFSQQGQSTAVQEAEWGWGQKTRRDVKKKQEILQKLSGALDDDDDDADIADLLED